MTTVYFVRHAQPNYENHDDYARELTLKGLHDRMRAAALLADTQVDVVLSSPYLRSVDTVRPIADQRGLPIIPVPDFRERRIDSVWIDDFHAFAQRQWADFDYKLSDGESLREVQARNVAALRQTVTAYAGQTVVVGSHGTALSTIINYFDPTFGYEQFETFRQVMPWVVRFTFDAQGACTDICTCELPDV